MRLLPCSYAWNINAGTAWLTSAVRAPLTGAMTLIGSHHSVLSLFLCQAMAFGAALVALFVDFSSLSFKTHA